MSSLTSPPASDAEQRQRSWGPIPELDPAELRRIETRLQLPPIAHRSQQMTDHREDVWALPFVRVTSYIVWQSGIFLIALTNAVVLALVLTTPGLLN